MARFREPGPAQPRVRHLTIVGQDPSVVRRDGRILTVRVPVPAEKLGPGPMGYRVQVVDYDATRERLYPALEYQDGDDGMYVDPFEDVDDHTVLTDNRFHAQNVYAIGMRTLARFEQALGRRVSWRFKSHQLKIVPHAFTEANAFYTRNEEAVLFGYFPSLDGKHTIHSCLAHDVIVHETTHAILDGLRERFIDPSSSDQAAFHEGFADIVALLSVFALPGVVDTVLAHSDRQAAESNQIRRELVTADALRESVLLGLAEQMGQEMAATRGRALRHSALLERSPKYMQDDEFRPPHRRGEIFVAAMMNTFVDIWAGRLAGVRQVDTNSLDRTRVVEEGETIAERLLTMAIRALDYTPPVHLQFSDYLSAIITADAELHPESSRYRFREHLRETFAAYGIVPASGSNVPSLSEQQVAMREGIGLRDLSRRFSGEHARVQRDSGAIRALGTRAAGSDVSTSQDKEAVAAAVPSPSGSRGPEIPDDIEEGAWVPCDNLELSYSRTHFEPMVREPDEVFKFIWENREVLRLHPSAYTEVLSVRPCLRIAPDGFALKETVAEFYQVLRLRVDELRSLGIDLADLPTSTVVPMYGGGTLVFDEFGRLRFYLHNTLDNFERQRDRLLHLASHGYFRRESREALRGDFSELHRLRAIGSDRTPAEEW
jgi:hypothetical protein